MATYIEYVYIEYHDYIYIENGYVYRVWLHRVEYYGYIYRVAMIAILYICSHDTLCKYVYSMTTYIEYGYVEYGYIYSVATYIEYGYIYIYRVWLRI